MEKILITRAGYEKLLRELQHLSRVERPQIVQELLETAQDGGVDRNPDFQIVLAQRQRLERRIKQLQQTLANAEVLVGSNLTANRVRFNCRVKVLHLNSARPKEFKLVGGVEADAAIGHLSVNSPLGRALMGRAVGDRVTLQTPGGIRSYQILEIAMEEI